MDVIAKIGFWLRQKVNVKMGVIAGFVTGSIVYYINYKHGHMVALSAFTKQFAYNFCMAGVNVGLCERLAKEIKRTWMAILLATIVPTAVAFVGVYSVHYFLHTPNPFANTIWQAGINTIIFFVTGLAYHKELERKYKWVRFVISSKRRIEMRYLDSDE